MQPFEAFISYKHGSASLFAGRLEQALKTYAKPLLKWPIRIFRDERHLVPGSDLPKLIKNALDVSQFFVLLASPEAVNSDWVNDELRIWVVEKAQTDRLIIVLTAGTIAVDSKTKSIDWERSDALPRWLAPYMPSAPLYLDARSLVDARRLDLADIDFKRMVNAITARIRGIDPNDMLGEEVVQQRRNVRLKNGALAALALMAIGLGLSLYLTIESRSEAFTQLYRSSLILAKEQFVGARPSDSILALETVPHSRRDWLWRLVMASVRGPKRTLLGHTYWTFDAVGAHDSELILSAGADNMVMVWNLSSTKPLYRIKPGIGRVLRIYPIPATTQNLLIGEAGIAFLDETSWKVTPAGGIGCSIKSDGFEARSDGRQIMQVIEGRLCTVTLPITSKSVVHTIAGDISQARYLPNNEILVVRGKKGVIEWRSSRDLALLGSVSFDRMAIVDIAGGLPDSSLVASDAKGALRILSRTSSKEPKVVMSAEEPVQMIGFIQGDDLVWAMTVSNKVIIWDLKTKKKLHEFSAIKGVLSNCERSSMGGYLACAAGGTQSDGAAPSVYLWHLAPPYFQSTLRGHLDDINSIRFLGEEMVLTTSEDGTIKIWPIQDNAILMHLAPHKLAGTLRIALSRDAKTAIVASDQGIAELWETHTGTMLSSIPIRGEPQHIALDPAAQKAAIATSSGVVLWDLRDNSVSRILQEANVTASTFHSGSQHLAVAQPGSVELLEMGNLKSVWRIQLGSHGTVRSLSFRAGGDQIAVACDDGTVRILAAADGHEITKLLVALYFGQNESPVFFAEYDRAGRRLLVGTALMGASIWDVETRKLVTSFPNHGPRVWVSGGAFVDDSHVLSTGLDGTVRVWEAMTGTELALLPLKPIGDLNEAPALSIDAQSMIAAITRPGHIDVLRLFPQ